MMSTLRAHQQYPNLAEVEGFETWVEFINGYDCIVHPCGERGCGDRPGSSHGRHGVDVRWYLRGPLGATQFVIYTDWLPPGSPVRPNRLSYRGRPDFPMAADLGFHSPRPVYEGQESMGGGVCDVIGAPCFYDGSGLNAEPVLDRLLTEGGDGVWRSLRSYYDETFTTETAS